MGELAASCYEGILGTADMLTVNIRPVIKRKAIALAAKNGVTLDAFVEEGLVRLLEDEIDSAAVEKALRNYDPSKNISMEQMRSELGLDS